MNNQTQSPYIGRPVDEVMQELKGQNQRARISQKDGQNYMLTMDFVIDRYNFAVKDGLIVSVSMG